MRLCTLGLTSLLFVLPAHAQADRAPNAVTDWALIVQQAIHNANAPRPPASATVLHATVVLAMYDAVVAIEGGSEPYGAAIHAWPGADVRAAVATAAFITARARVAASQYPYLDEQYAGYLARIPDSIRKVDGIRVGRRAASLILKRRANDGFDTVVLYECSAIPPPAGQSGLRLSTARQGVVRPVDRPGPRRAAGQN